jgi:hypothetical protein
LPDNAIQASLPAFVGSVYFINLKVNGCGSFAYNVGSVAISVGPTLLVLSNNVGPQLA